eukprot:gene1085-2115_t
MESTKRESALADLDLAQQEVLELLAKAHETCESLSQRPDVDGLNIEKSSKEYLELVQSIRSRIRKHSGFLMQYTPYGQGNYGLNMELQVADAHARLFKEDSK